MISELCTSNSLFPPCTQLSPHAYIPKQICWYHTGCPPNSTFDPIESNEPFHLPDSGTRDICPANRRKSRARRGGKLTLFPVRIDWDEFKGGEKDTKEGGNRNRLFFWIIQKPPFRTHPYFFCSVLFGNGSGFAVVLDRYAMPLGKTIGEFLLGSFYVLVYFTSASGELKFPNSLRVSLSAFRGLLRFYLMCYMHTCLIIFDY